MTIAVTAPAPVDVRAREAALACIGRFGLAKTTIDDIAREAGRKQSGTTSSHKAWPWLSKRSMAA